MYNIFALVLVGIYNNTVSYLEGKSVLLYIGEWKEGENITVFLCRWYYSKLLFGFFFFYGVFACGG